MKDRYEIAVRVSFIAVDGTTNGETYGQEDFVIRCDSDDEHACDMAKNIAIIQSDDSIYADSRIDYRREAEILSIVDREDDNDESPIY